jgi:hypothetical protein
MIAFNGRLLQRAIHALDLSIGREMIGLGQAMLDAVFSAAHVEHMGHVCRRRTVAVLRQIGELDPVIGQDSVDFLGDRFNQGLQESGRGPPIGFAFELGESELGRAVDRHEKIEFSLFGSDLGDIDVKEADRIGLELFLVGLVTLDLRQPADPVALQTSIQR